MASSNTNVRRVENLILSDFVLKRSVAMLLLVCLCFQSLLAAPIGEEPTHNIDDLSQKLAKCGPPSPTFYTFNLHVTERSQPQTKFDAACRVRLQKSSVTDVYENVKHALCTKFVQRVNSHCLQEPDIETKYKNMERKWFAYQREVDTKAVDLCIGVQQVLGQTLSQEYCNKICGDLEFRALCRASAFIENILPQLNLGTADIGGDHLTKADDEGAGLKNEDNVNDGTATGDQQGDQPPENAGNNLGNGGMETPETGNGETNPDANAMITAGNGENNGGANGEDIGEVIGHENGNVGEEPVGVEGVHMNPNQAEPNQPDTTHLQPEGANPLEGGIQPKEENVPAVAGPGGPQFTRLTGQDTGVGGVAANIPTANGNKPVFSPPMAPNAPLGTYNPPGGNNQGAGGGVNNPGMGWTNPGVGGVNNPITGGNNLGAGGPYNPPAVGNYQGAGGNIPRVYNPGAGGNIPGVNNPGAGAYIPGGPYNQPAGNNLPGGVPNQGTGTYYPAGGYNPGANYAGVNNQGAGGNIPGANNQGAGGYILGAGENNPGIGVKYPGAVGNIPGVNNPGAGGNLPGVAVNNLGTGGNIPGAGRPYNTATGVGVNNPAMGVNQGNNPAGGNNTPLGGETNPPGASPLQPQQEGKGEENPPQGDEAVQEQGDTAYNTVAAYDNGAANTAEGGEVNGIVNTEESETQGGQGNGKESQAGGEPQPQYPSDYSIQDKGNEQYQGQDQGYQYQGQDQGYQGQDQGYQEQQDQGVKYGSQYGQDENDNEESESSDFESAEWTNQDANSADYSIFEKEQKANVEEEEQKYLDNHGLEVGQSQGGQQPLQSGGNQAEEAPVKHETFQKQDDTKYQIAEESSSSHFLAYSLTAIILIMATYLLYHNKQKIIAIIIEGKSTSGRRRRGDGYNKLNQNVTEVMPSLQQSSKDYTF